MMRFISFVVAVLFATTTLAQPKPHARLADLKVFTGTWQCSGTAFASQFGPEHPTTAKIKVTWPLGGFWLNAQYAEQKTAKNPNPAAGHVYWGFDEGGRKFTGYAVDNFGGYVVLESDGWHGDTIVWNGTLYIAGTSFKTRDSFVQTAKGVFSHQTQAELGSQWVTLNEETCRRTS